MQNYLDYVCRFYAKERMVARFLEAPWLLDDLRRSLESEDIVDWAEPTRRQSTDTSGEEAAP